MRRILGLVFGVTMLLGVATGVAPVSERVMAWDDPACADMDADERELANCGTTSGGGEDSLMKKVVNVLNTVLPLVAVLAVVMIVISGVMMSVSMGDAGKVKRAKNVMIYSLVGMVVALMAWGIVNFAMDAIE